MNNHFTNGFEKRAMSFPTKAAVRIKRFFNPETAKNVNQTMGVADKVKNWYNNPTRKILTGAAMGVTGVAGGAGLLYAGTHKTIGTEDVKNEW